MSATALRRVLPRLAALQPATPAAARRYASSDSPPTPSAPPASPVARTPTASPVARTPMNGVLEILKSKKGAYSQARSTVPAINLADLGFMGSGSSAPQEDDYHLHIYATKHNTHITFTRPDKSPIVSQSAGNVGFKKGHRGTYDAAYQLATHVFKMIEDKKIMPRAIEVVLRGFGQGREAVVKALLGQEGRFLKPVVKRVTDSTRLKFGGTRSPRPRRLG